MFKIVLKENSFNRSAIIYVSPLNRECPSAYTEKRNAPLLKGTSPRYEYLRGRLLVKGKSGSAGLNTTNPARNYQHTFLGAELNLDLEIHLVAQDVAQVRFFKSIEINVGVID